MKERVFTEEDIKQIISLRNEGFTYPEISELTGFDPNSIRAKMSLERRKRGMDVLKGHLKQNAKSAQKSTSEPESKPEPVKEKTLYDFSAREILYHLFNNLHYKIDENGLYQEQIIKNRVKLNDIIDNG